MGGADEDGWLERARQGDREAFRHLVERYQRLVAMIVYRIVPDHDDGLELCQEVFLKVYQSLGSYRAEAGLSTWVGRIARNTSLNHLKKRKTLSFSSVTGVLDVAEVAATTAGPEQVLVAEERQRLLVRELAKLPEIDRTMLVLFHQEGLSYEEIGQVVDLPVSGVKSHLFRARCRLREKLGSGFAPREAV